MAKVVIPGFRKIETWKEGTGDYNSLSNIPFINNVIVKGNLKTEDLKLTDPTLTKEGVPADAKAVGTKLEESVSALKGDIVNSKKAILDLNDQKITKFYANNLGETTLNDSDNGKIHDMMLYGKSEQKSYTGKNLFKAKNEGIITVTDDGLLLNGTIDVHQWINFTIPAGSYFIGEMNGQHYLHSYFDGNDDYMKDVGTITFETDKKLLFYIVQGTYNNKLIKPYIVKGSNPMETYEPYVGGIPSPNPDYPQDIKSVVNPVVTLHGGSINVLSKKQLEVLANDTSWHDDKHVVTAGIDGVNYSLCIWDVSNYSSGDEFCKVKIYNVNGANSYNGYHNSTYNNAKLLYSNVEIDSFLYYSKMKVVKTDSNETIGLPDRYKTATITYTLNAIPVSDGGNVTIDGQQYIADYLDIENKKLVRMVDESKLDTTVSIIDNTDLLLETPTITDLTDEEVQAFKELATYYPTTNVMVTSDQLDGFTTFNYPLSMANGWNLIKEQIGDTRDYIYDMDLQSAEAYVNSEYAVALAELEV